MLLLKFSGVIVITLLTLTCAQDRPESISSGRFPGAQTNTQFRNVESPQSTSGFSRPQSNTQFESSEPVLSKDIQQSISQGADQFAFEFFDQLSTQVPSNTDFMISPFAVWSLLLLLAEGAGGNTLQQLRDVLHIGDDELTLRKAFRDTSGYLTVNRETVEVASLLGVFTDLNQPLLRDYEKVIERYRAFMMSVDFSDPETTYMRINDQVKQETRGLIEKVIHPDDLKNARLLLISTLYFKGQWKHQFNRTLTRYEPFYDEAGEVVANVPMMVQMAHFPYASIDHLEGIVLELPYGVLNRLSMLIILPKKNVPLSRVIGNLKHVRIATIFQRLALSEQDFEEDAVEVIMPKFNTKTDFAIPTVLYKMGIRDVFLPDVANFSRMSERELSVSSVLHATKIIVDEEGTTAAAATSAVLINKTSPPKFLFNRPFIYLIVEKSVNLVLFVGRVVNPKF